MRVRGSLAAWQQQQQQQQQQRWLWWRSGNRSTARCSLVR